MPDREKVINALLNCTSIPKCLDCHWEECSEFDHAVVNRVPLHLLQDALELLKAQEPRVLTIEEVEALEEGTIVWVEENYGGQRYLNPMVCNGDGFFGNFYLGIDINIWLCDGKKRFWNSKPTKEQSAATPWEKGE